MKHQTLLTGFTIFSFIMCSAQSTANSAGGTLSGAAGTAGYSSGNVFYKELSGSAGSTAPGTQMPYVIVSVLETADQNLINLEMVIHPNPVTDYLHLKIDSDNAISYLYELYDAKGSLLQTKKINGKMNDIVMSSYPSGVYFLSVMKDRKIVKTFKIIKK